jgi:hypothetical protein
MRAMSDPVLIALIGIVPAVLTAIIGYLQGKKSSDTNDVKKELEAKNSLMTLLKIRITRN